MTTERLLTIKCPVCEEEFETHILMSTNTMGYPDLDLRPAEMERSTMYISINECPSCGYAGFDFHNKPAIDEEYLKTDEYKNCDGIEFKSDRSKPFYKAYLINKKEGNKGGEINLLLHSIWSCDDAEDFENAKRLRIRASELLGEIINHIEIYESIGDKNTLLLMKADLMRRGGQFEELIEEYENITFEESQLNDIAQFQIEKAKEKDDNCYTVASVINKSH